MNISLTTSAGSHFAPFNAIGLLRHLYIDPLNQNIGIEVPYTIAKPMGHALVLHHNPNACAKAAYLGMVDTLYNFYVAELGVPQSADLLKSMRASWITATIAAGFSVMVEESIVTARMLRLPRGRIDAPTVTTTRKRYVLTRCSDTAPAIIHDDATLLALSDIEAHSTFDGSAARSLHLRELVRAQAQLADTTGGAS